MSRRYKGRLMKLYLILIAISLVLFGFASKLIDFVKDLRVKKGLSKIIKIIINDNETVILDQAEGELCFEPNFVFTKKNKAIKFGSLDASNKINRNFSKKNQKIHFIHNLDQAEKVMDDFWYQFITYYVLKYKRENKISSFITVSASINIKVSSTALKEKIKLGIESARLIKKPRFYNIIDIN